MKGSTILSNSNLSENLARRLIGNSGLMALILAMSMPANAFQIPTLHASSLTNISKAFSPEALNKLDYALEIGKSLGRNYIIPGAKNLPTVVSNAFTGTLNQFSNITNQFSTTVNQCLPVIKEVITRNPYMSAFAIALPIVDFLIRLHYSLVDSANMQIVREAMTNENFFNKAGCKEEILEYRAEEEESLSRNTDSTEGNNTRNKKSKKQKKHLEKVSAESLLTFLKDKGGNNTVQNTLKQYLKLAKRASMDWIKANPNSLKEGNPVTIGNIITMMQQHVYEKTSKFLNTKKQSPEFLINDAKNRPYTFLDKYIKYVTPDICEFIYEENKSKLNSLFSNKDSQEAIEEKKINQDIARIEDQTFTELKNKFSTQNIIRRLTKKQGRSLFAFLTGKGQNEKVQEVIKNTIDKYLTSATIESMIWIKKNPDSLRVNTQEDIDDKIKQMQGDVRIKMLNLENIAEKYKEFWPEGADDGSSSFLAKYIECVTPAICRFIYSLNKYTPLNEVRDGKFILEITDAVKQEFDTQKIIDILYKR